MTVLLQEYRSLARRRLLILLGMVLALIASFLLDLSAGSADLGPLRILKAFSDPDSLELRYQIILFDVRLPDALIALAVGAALGLAGIETQTVLNNPLASPFTLGLSSFASLGASLSIVVAPVFGGFINPDLMTPALALLFALGCGALVLAFSQWAGGSRENIILFGIALFFLGEALTAGLQYVATAEAVQAIVFWGVGNLTKAGWDEVLWVSVCVLIILPFSLRQVWALTLLRVGETHAESLGLNRSRIRFWSLLRVSTLCAFAICFVGVIGFVGLVGPHIARMLLGEDHRFLVPGAVLSGALLLSLASWLSKALIPGVIIPVGIITALIGVPVFIYLIIRQRQMV